LCYMALGVRHDIHFSSRHHIRGVDNITCDALSRNSTPAMLGFTTEQIINPLSDRWLHRLLCACNPKLEEKQQDVHPQFYEESWREAFAIAEGLIQ